MSSVDDNMPSSSSSQPHAGTTASTSLQTQQQQQVQQEHPHPLAPIIKTHTAKFNNVVEDSSMLSEEETTPNVDLDEVIEELGKPRQLDNSEIKRFTMRELSAPQLSGIEDPDTFYSSIKAYMDSKIDSGDTSFTTTKMINSLNEFIDSRMNKILMTCFRHYNNEKILQEQKEMMTPQELEMATKIIENIKSFREFIYH